MAWSPLAPGVLAGRGLQDTGAVQTLLGAVGSGIQAKYANAATLPKAQALQSLANDVGISMGLSQQRYKKCHRNWRRSGSIGMLICNCFGLVPTKERNATLGIS